uniref:RRM domain-containing protein n=1 Tax=Mesocestoides corti TaxID=53468 RepID=A0A5K3EYC5_MESCO
MGKKGKKNRFNQVLDIDISYSSHSVIDGGASLPPEVNLSKEKVSELQRIKANLPTAPQAVRIEEEIARIPECGPFRVVLVNVPYAATRSDIENFFDPIQPTQIRTIEDDGRFRGFCFIDFASKADLLKALEKDNSFIHSRRVTMRIADQQNDSGGRRGYGGRDGFSSRRPDFRRGYEAGGGGGEQTESIGWTRRASRPTPQTSQPGSFSRSSAPAPVVGPPAERPVIRLAPRILPLDQSEERVESAQYSAIFGAAKPVDIVAREREIEKKMASASLSGDKSVAPKISPTPTSQTVPDSSSEKKMPPQDKPRQSAWAKPLVSNRE